MSGSSRATTSGVSRCQSKQAGIRTWASQTATNAQARVHLRGDRRDSESLRGSVSDPRVRACPRAAKRLWATDALPGWRHVDDCFGALQRTPDGHVSVDIASVRRRRSECGSRDCVARSSAAAVLAPHPPIVEPQFVLADRSSPVGRRGLTPAWSLTWGVCRELLDVEQTEAHGVVKNQNGGLRGGRERGCVAGMEGD
jgi:hypothetical protein